MSKSSTLMDIEMGRPNANATSAHGYFKEAIEFGMILDNMAKMVHELKGSHQEFNSSTESAAMKEIKLRMEKDIDEVGKMAHVMKEKLRKLIIKNIDNRKNPGCEKGTDIDISRMALTLALKRRIKEKESDFQDLAVTIRQEYLNVIQRKIFTVTGMKLSDEVIRVVDTSSMVQMFENTQKGITAEQMASAVDEINERHVTATDLDKKILEVKKKFEQMVTLVEAEEKFDKAHKVQKLARSTADAEEELCYNILLTIVISLWLGILFSWAYLMMHG